MSTLQTFIKESNRIEGIIRAPTKSEILVHEWLLALTSPTVADLQHFVRTVARREIRDQQGMDVVVGSHHPPRGGPAIPEALGFILDNAKRGVGPYETHQRYEALHPFMDGNGRSGRALWLWQMVNQVKDPYVLSRGFLHTFYYQALAHGDRP